VGLFDVGDVIEKDRVLLISILTLGRGSGEHQSHAAAIEE